MQSFYRKVVCFAASPCRCYVASGCSDGFLSICRLVPDKDLLCQERLLPSTIFSLKTWKRWLFCGLSNGRVVGLLWEDLLAKKFEIKLEFDLNSYMSPPSSIDEVTALATIEDDILLAAGGPSGKICSINLENRSLDKVFTDHDDTVTKLCSQDKESQTNSDNQATSLIPAFTFCSSSNDGSVKLYDRRCSTAVHSLTPSNHPKVGRPTNGKWLGTVSLSRGSDWLVCGGGPRLSVWHLKTGTLLSPLMEADNKNMNYLCSAFIGGSGEGLLVGAGFSSGGPVVRDGPVQMWQLNEPESILSVPLPAVRRVVDLLNQTVPGSDNVGKEELLLAAGSSGRVAVLNGPSFAIVSHCIEV